MCLFAGCSEFLALENKSNLQKCTWLWGTSPGEHLRRSGRLRPGSGYQRLPLQPVRLLVPAALEMLSG